MGSTTVCFQKSFIVTAPEGLHLRPAAMLVSIANRFESTIKLRHEAYQADAKSIMSVITLEATCGAEVILEIQGEDAQEAMASIAALFESCFAPDHDGKNLVQ